MVENPRSNSVAKRMQLTMSDMLRTTDFKGPDWKEKNRHLATVSRMGHTFYSMTTGFTPDQLVFCERHDYASACYFRLGKDQAGETTSSSYHQSAGEQEMVRLSVQGWRECSSQTHHSG